MRIDRGFVGNLIGAVYVVVLITIVLLLMPVSGHCEDVTLTASPKMSIAHPVNGSLVAFRLKVSGEWVCAGRRWYWPDDTRSYHEMDCDPNGLPESDSETVRRRFGPGEYEICVGLEQPEGKTVHKVCEKIHVGG